MTDQHLPTEIRGFMLAEAFSPKHSPVALMAGETVAGQLVSRQRAKRFIVHAEGQSLLIPERLNFASHDLPFMANEDAWRFARALQTRSNNGFERQRAARDLLTDMQPWAAPFVVALIGEYVVEILEDVATALTPETARTLGAFVSENPSYWHTIKRRVMSYWSVYYRRHSDDELVRTYRRHEYVGFKLVGQLEKAASGQTQSGT